MAKGYTTEEKVERYLGESFSASTTPNSTAIAEWIEWAEAEIDERCRTSFTTATSTNEIIDFNEDTSYSSAETLHWLPAVDRTNQLSFLYNDTVHTKYSPIISVTSLYKNMGDIQTGDNWTQLTEGAGNDFIVRLDEGEIVFIDNKPRYGLRSIKLTYTYGYATVPKVVEKLATLMVVSEILRYKLSNSQFTTTDDVQVESTSIRKNVTQSANYLDDIENKIETLFNKVGNFKTQTI